jgi:peptidoglycan/LPS O-acetylase OafA/YrhL
MNKWFSAYLDTTRLLAALVVFFGHITFVNPDSIFTKIELGSYGNDAVMIFFVLSGFVIGHVSKTKETDIYIYIYSRISRLLSIIWPALILTVLFDQAGRYFNHEIYDNSWWYKGDWPAIRFLANSLLINQIWFFEIRPFSNGPFWSLGYEVWFYFLFIPLGFSIKYKKITLIALLFFAGPRIIILYPTWLLGYYLYLTVSKKRFSAITSLILTISSVFAYVLYRSFYGEAGFTRLLFNDEDVFHLGRSFRFVDNYFVALLVFSHFLGLYNILRNLSDELLPNIIFLVNKKMASCTFAIYAVHYPIIYFIFSISKNNLNIYNSSLLVILPLIIGAGVTFIGEAIRRGIFLFLCNKLKNLVKP